MHDEIVVFEVMTETLDAGGGGITQFGRSGIAGWLELWSARSGGFAAPQQKYLYTSGGENNG